MRVIIWSVCLAAVALPLTAVAVDADEWDYVYGGVDDPQIMNKFQWSQEGFPSTTPNFGTEPWPIWNLDTDIGTKAIKFTWPKSRPSAQGYYQGMGIESGHPACIVQMRVKVVSASTTIGNAHFTNLRYSDCRSRFARRTDVPVANGGTGDDFRDRDNPVPGQYPIAQYDGDWHTYTLVMVDPGPDPLNPTIFNCGTYSYWDGQFSHYRQSALTGGSLLYRFDFGMQGLPTASTANVYFWVDYLAYGFDDDPDEYGSYGWVETVRDKGHCTAVTETTLTDDTKNWTENEFADDYWLVDTDRKFRIASNTATTITIQSGDMVAKNVTVGDEYRIIRNDLGDLPYLDPDQANTGDRLVNYGFDDNADGTAQPTGWQCYPPVPTPPPSFPDWAVRGSYIYGSKSVQAHRMYGGANYGDSESEARDYYLYQTYTTKSPDDVLPATYYASTMALTLSEGGEPSNCRVRVGVGKNLTPTTPPDQYDPADPNIVWGDWVSTQGYPWTKAPMVEVTSDTIGDRLTMFIELNQQAEYLDKYNLVLVDYAWLHTKPFMNFSNICANPTSADSTTFRWEWDTDVPSGSRVHWDNETDKVWDRWFSGPGPATHHTVDMAGSQMHPSCKYNILGIASDECERPDFAPSEDQFAIRSGPDLLTPVITVPPTFDARTATVTWDTDVPTTTQVDFRARGVGDLTSAPWTYGDATLTTHHVAVLTDWSKAPVPAGENPIMPGDLIWFRCKGRNSTVIPAYKYCYSAFQSRKDWHTGKFQYDPAPPFTASLGELRKRPSGTLVACTGKTVTGCFAPPPLFSGFSYIEEQDRTAGIKVVWGPQFLRGDVVDVTGMLQTIDGERQIVASDVVYAAGGTAPAPLAMTNRAIAAGAIDGAEAQGMLVTAFGRSTYVGPDAVGNWCVYLDDGSGCQDGSGFGAGIRVYSDVYPLVGEYCVVRRGCVGAKREGNLVVPAVWVMDPSEVETIPQ